jgi:hypothetical protein
MLNLFVAENNAIDMVYDVLAAINDQPHTFYLCSSNENCVNELIRIRTVLSKNYKVGYIMVSECTPLPIDFVIIDEACDKQLKEMKRRLIKVYARCFDSPTGVIGRVHLLEPMDV